MLKKNILVIGGSYFAGRALVQRLAKKDDIDLYTFNRGNIPLGISGVEELHGDRTDPRDVAHGIPELAWDAVIDFCAYTPDNLKTVLQSVSGSIKQYIFISTASVYDHDGLPPFDETARRVSSVQDHLGEYARYGLDKAEAETWLETTCSKNDIQWTIFRPAIVYGKFNYAPRESYFFDLIDNNETVILPENTLALFSFIFVEDLAGIIAGSIGNPLMVNNYYNTAAPEYVSYPAYIRCLEKALGKKIITANMSVTDIIKHQIPLPFPVDHHQIYSGRKLDKVLPIQFTPLEKGLEKTYRFHQLLARKKQGM